ncbi:MAG: DUF2799 domain-containing protein [Pseudomonadales bacterium]|jgi:hypothetical protein|nr:DUF2799 domain-containing protein [Pseudomonadales bacterium]
MNDRWRIAVLLSAVGALTSCASLSQRECAAADWYSIGVRDGANGRGEEYIAEHAKACAKLAITPDREPWLDGRDRGLERYCTPRSGYTVGEVGGRYDGVCFALGEGSFLRGYELGRQVHRVKNRLDFVENEIRSLTQATGNDKLTADERNRLIYRLREYEYERGFLAREYNDLAWRGRSL